MRHAYTKCIMWRSADFLRHIESENKGREAIKFTCVCDHSKLFLVEEFLWWVAANRGEKKETKNHERWCGACGMPCGWKRQTDCSRCKLETANVKTLRTCCRPIFYENRQICLNYICLQNSFLQLHSYYSKILFPLVRQNASPIGLMWEFKVGVALKKCLAYGNFSSSRRRTWLHVEESLVACSKAHRLLASDTPLKNASGFRTRASAPGLCKGKF